MAKRKQPPEKRGGQTAEILANAHKQLNVAIQHKRAGNLAKAQSICETLIQKHPDYVGALHTLGLVLMAQEKFWPALSCLMRAAMLNPADWSILTSLSQVYLGLGASEVAAQTLEKAIALNPDDANVHFTLGRIYDHEREYELAAESFEKAVKLDPELSPAWFDLGGVYVHMGETEKAANAFLNAHRVDPQFVHPVSSLSQLPSKAVGIDVLQAIDAVDRGATKTDDDLTVRLGFARAAALDRAGNHVEAWKNLRLANDMHRRLIQSDPAEQAERRSSALKRAEAFKSDMIAPPEEGLPISLFVLGASRSGKTTVEQLVARIPGVKRGYENRIVEIAARRASQVSGLLTIDALRQLPLSLDGRFADTYKAELLRRASGASVFTNTHPGRIADVARIARVVPNAKFVFVKRNADDTALRIYQKRYRDYSNAYAYDVSDIYDEIAWYHRLIGIFADKLGSACVVLNYDDLVEDPALVGGAIARLCGLPEPDDVTVRVGDDRGCSRPYEAYMTAAREGGR